VEFVQKIVDCFWKRWKLDVFPTLVPRKKWIVERRNVRIDDIVVMEDTNTVRVLGQLEELSACIQERTEEYET
jgi:hypothetical protein